MFVRSTLTAAALGLTLAVTPAMAAEDAKSYKPVVTEDGMYTQPWFAETFLDLGDDLAEAQAQGKRLAIIWEQKGCPYCKETHNVNFAVPEINEFVNDKFMVLQLNLWGSREVTDFDGEVMEERDLARKYGVVFTPTIQFFPEDPAAVEGKEGQEIEVARMPGYFRPFHFMTMFEYVDEKGYEDQHFQKYLGEKIEELRAEGKEPGVW